MPTRRSHGVYYVQRKVPGIGKVYRSLETDRKAVAVRREQAILALGERGHADAIQAWLDGDVDLASLVDAHETGRAHELAARARRADAGLGEAIDAALRDKAPDVADSTLARYRTGLGHFRAHCGDDAGVRDALTTDRVQSFKAHRLDVDGVAKETVNNDLIAVSILCTYALRRGWIDERPEIRKFESKVRINYLDPGDLAPYMAEIRSAIRPYMKLLVGTGMRRGEVEALTPADLRLGNDEARAEIDDAKTPSGVRTVFIPRWAADAVLDHIEREGRARGERIFQFDDWTLRREHDRARKAIGRPRYTMHDHRHTAAVHLARAGMPLHLLQAQLGHANVDQTMRYARFHPDYGDVAEYFDRAGRRLGLAGRAPDNSSNNTPAAERAEAARA